METCTTNSHVVLEGGLVELTGPTKAPCVLRTVGYHVLLWPTEPEVCGVDLYYKLTCGVRGWVG